MQFCTLLELRTQKHDKLLEREELRLNWIINVLD